MRKNQNIFNITMAIIAIGWQILPLFLGINYYFAIFVLLPISAIATNLIAQEIYSHFKNKRYEQNIH